MVPHLYTLMVKDDKGDDYNVVLLKGYSENQRAQAFADLETLKRLCDVTVTAWIEVDELTPDQTTEDIIERICRH